MGRERGNGKPDILTDTSGTTFPAAGTAGAPLYSPPEKPAMRPLLALVVAAAPLFGGCGSPPAAPHPATAAAPPTQTGPAPSATAGGLDSEITVAPEIARAWRAVRLRVVDAESGGEQLFEVALGGAELLGESGLVISVEAFIPDFVMSERGIGSRSAEPHNPAARVVISEGGVEGFRGWLFAAMPENFSYENPRYRVLLIEGVPAS